MSDPGMEEEMPGDTPVDGEGQPYQAEGQDALVQEIEEGVSTFPIANGEDSTGMPRDQSDTPEVADCPSEGSITSIPRSDTDAPETWEGVIQAPPESESTKPRRKSKAKHSTYDGEPKEVDFFRNPTILSRLILHQKFPQALKRLARHPEEAAVWVCTKRKPIATPQPSVSAAQTSSSSLHNSWPERSSTSDPKPHVYTLRQLPIHMVCNHFILPDPTVREDLERLLIKLIVAYPEAAGMTDHAGQLALHEAIWHDASPITISFLLMACPEAAERPDKYGRTPTELNFNRITGNNHDRIHALLTKGLDFWNTARQEALLRLRHGNLPSTEESVNSLSVLGDDDISSIATIETSVSRTGSVYQREKEKRKGLSSSNASLSLASIPDDQEVATLSWAQLEKRAIHLEQLLEEQYQQNFELGELVANSQEEIKTLKEHLQALQSSGDLQQTVGDLQYENQNLKKEIKRLEGLLLRNLVNEYGGTPSEIATGERQQAAVVAAASAGATSALTNATIKELEDRNKELQERNKESQEQNKELQEQVKKLAQQLKKSRKDKEGKPVTEDRVAELTEELDEYRKKVDEDLKEVQMAKETIKSLLGHIETLSSQLESSRSVGVKTSRETELEETVGELQGQVVDLTQQLDVSRSQVEENQNREQESEKLADELRRKEEIVISLQEQIVELTQQVNSSRREVEEEKKDKVVGETSNVFPELESAESRPMDHVQNEEIVSESSRALQEQAAEPDEADMSPREVEVDDSELQNEDSGEPDGTAFMLSSQETYPALSDAPCRTEDQFDAQPDSDEGGAYDEPPAPSGYDRDNNVIEEGESRDEYPVPAQEIAPVELEAGAVSSIPEADSTDTESQEANAKTAKGGTKNAEFAQPVLHGSSEFGVVVQQRRQSTGSEVTFAFSVASESGRTVDDPVGLQFATSERDYEEEEKDLAFAKDLDKDQESCYQDNDYFSPRDNGSRGGRRQLQTGNNVKPSSILSGGDDSLNFSERTGTVQFETKSYDGSKKSFDSRKSFDSNSNHYARITSKFEGFEGFETESGSVSSSEKMKQRKLAFVLGGVLFVLGLISSMRSARSPAERDVPTLAETGDKSLPVQMHGDWVGSHWVLGRNDFRLFSAEEVRDYFSAQRFLFVGDSAAKNSFETVVSMLNLTQPSETVPSPKKGYGRGGESSLKNESNTSVADVTISSAANASDTHVSNVTGAKKKKQKKKKKKTKKSVNSTKPKTKVANDQFNSSKAEVTKAGVDNSTMVAKGETNSSKAQVAKDDTNSSKTQVVREENNSSMAVGVKRKKNVSSEFERPEDVTNSSEVETLKDDTSGSTAEVTKEDYANTTQADPDPKLDLISNFEGPEDVTNSSEDETVKDDTMGSKAEVTEDVASLTRADSDTKLDLISNERIVATACKDPYLQICEDAPQNPGLQAHYSHFLCPGDMVDMLRNLNTSRYDLIVFAFHSWSDARCGTSELDNNRTLDSLELLKQGSVAAIGDHGAEMIVLTNGAKGTSNIGAASAHQDLDLLRQHEREFEEEHGSISSLSVIDWEGVTFQHSVLLDEFIRTEELSRQAPEARVVFLQMIMNHVQARMKKQEMLIRAQRGPSVGWAEVVFTVFCTVAQWYLFSARHPFNALRR